MKSQVISNRYVIEEKLGSGGMATVFLATDSSTNTKVAVKFLHPQYARDASYIERFIREAETAIQFDHPNMVRVLDYGSQKSEHFIVMEYVDGKSIAEVIRDEGKLAEDKALLIARSVAKALDYADNFGVVHRDIKPQNLMLTDENEVKVADFGIAKAASMATMTHAGMFIGSPAYTSPEQAKGEKVDIRSDIYSLGITLHEMLEGHPPFQSDNPWSIINMHIVEEPPIIDTGISPDIKEIMLKCLKKDPKERYQKPAELASDINRLLETRAAKGTETVNALDAKTVILVPSGNAMGQEEAPYASADHAEDTVNQLAETAIFNASDAQAGAEDRGTSVAKGSPGVPQDGAEPEVVQPDAKTGKTRLSPKAKALGLFAALVLLLFLLASALSSSEEPVNSPDQNATAKAQSEADSDENRSTATTKSPTTTEQKAEQTTTTIKSGKYFTIDSEKDEVLAAQGAPDSVTRVDDSDQEIWTYGSSSITFRDNEVFEYYNDSGTLNVRLMPKKEDEEIKHKGYFTYGSKRDVVLALQGTPDSVTRLDNSDQEIWTYGSSGVTFSDKKVIEYYNDSNNLKVKPR